MGVSCSASEETPELKTTCIFYFILYWFISPIELLLLLFFIYYFICMSIIVTVQSYTHAHALLMLSHCLSLSLTARPRPTARAQRQVEWPLCSLLFSVHHLPCSLLSSLFLALGKGKKENILSLSVSLWCKRIWMVINWHQTRATFMQLLEWILVTLNTTVFYFSWSYD